MFIYILTVCFLGHSGCAFFANSGTESLTIRVYHLDRDYKFAQNTLLFTRPATKLHRSTHVLCTRHLRQNVNKYLEDNVGYALSDRKDIVGAIFF